jgi:dipeptidyl-peptidase-4
MGSGSYWRPHYLCKVLALIALAGSLTAQKKPVTLDSLQSSGHTRSLPSIVWAPDGKRFAYVEENRVWEYDVPSGKRRELITLSTFQTKAVVPVPPEMNDWQNRRVAEQSIQWFPSGKDLLVLEGGDLFVLHTGSGDWTQLTATSDAERDPKVSPDGRFVSFRRLHDLYCLDVNTKSVRRLTSDGSATLFNAELDWVYPEELEISTAHWWAPDGHSIAYLQFDVSREPIFPLADLLDPHAKLEPERFPQPGTPNADVRLGVVAPEGGATRWMDLGETRDRLLARVYWSPDSRALAVERLNRVQNRLDLLFANAATGATRLVFTEQDPYWINVNDLFRFLPSGKFLWGSERDGFLHLYLHGNDGKEEQQITRGDWEVTALSGVDEAAHEIYYVSSDGSPLERRFYRIGMNGKHKELLSKAAGTHTISMGGTCEYYLDTLSSLAAPPRTTLHKRDGGQISIYRAPEDVEYEILPTEIEEVKAADGTLLYARMIKPAGFAAGKKYPVIVMVYGGPGAQSVRNLWEGATWDQALAQRGFLIWQLDNRGTEGRGHHFESQVFHNLGALELKDQQDGIRHLGSLGFADTSRMGIYGWSYGGYMTLYSLLHAPDLFRAGISGAPVTDWRNYDSIYTERYMGLPHDNAEGYRTSSPLDNADALASKLMIIHNLEDDNVHFQNSIQMANALELAGKRFQMLVYPGKSHAVASRLRKNLLEQMTAFFEENLRP